MWFSVRCVFDHGNGLYEERLTIWQAGSFEAAVELAEVEAREYGEMLDATYVGLAQAYALAEDQLRPATEVFSLMRASNLPADAYVARFFDTGTERQAPLEVADDDRFS